MLQTIMQMGAWCSVASCCFMVCFTFIVCFFRWAKAEG